MVENSRFSGVSQPKKNKVQPGTGTTASSRRSGARIIRKSGFVRLQTSKQDSSERECSFWVEMARKSQRVAAVSAASTRHKRAASNSMPLGTKTGPKKQKATPTKSQYFKQSKHYLGDAEDEDLDSEELSSAQEEDSAFESEVDEATSEDDEDEYDSDAERKLSSASKIKSTGIPKASPAMRTKENELLRPGVKTGFGPGTEVVIKKPKARPAGKTPYRDDAIHPNTLLFLEDLKANNERQWLKSECDESLSQPAQMSPPPTCAT